MATNHLASLMLAAVVAASIDAAQPRARSVPPPAPSAAACPANAKKANLNFVLKDTDGKPVNLADYKGKVLLLDFWATWCAPCKVEMPGFIDLYKTYKAKGFEVAGVVAMDEFSKAKPFALQFGINYPVLNGVDREDVEDAFGPLFALPTTLLIARDGRICARHVGLPTSKEQSAASVEDVKRIFEAQIKALL
jgi:thiol-disulfide isomerase/thioredoxin